MEGNTGIKVEEFRRMHFRKGKFAKFNIRNGKNIEVKDKARKETKADPRYKEL